jgi:hypothetical protein
MIPPDFSTLSPALRVAHRLATVGKHPEGLSLLRELLAGLVDSKQFIEIMQVWMVPGSGSPGLMGHFHQLPAIIENFAASGYATEAVRVLTTCIALDPGLSNQLLNTSRLGLFRSLSRSATDKRSSVASATRLADIGMNILRFGNPGGITLMGVAHRVAPDVAFPISEIAAHLDNLPRRQPVFLEIPEAQALTEAAYDFHFSGLQEPAVRVGTLIPSMLPWLDSHRLFMVLEFRAKPGATLALQASRKILEKGYAAEAINLLIDSEAISADELWTGLDRDIIRPSGALSASNWFNSSKRRAWGHLISLGRGRPPLPPTGRKSAGAPEDVTPHTEESPNLEPKRNLNAWIDDPRPKAGKVFHVSINIGAPKDSTLVSTPFAHLDWRGADFIDLMISVSSIDCDVDPSWQELKLPRTGDSETIKFAVTTMVPGQHEFAIRVYLAKQMIQLQSLSFKVAVADTQVQAIGT